MIDFSQDIISYLNHNLSLEKMDYESFYVELLNKFKPEQITFIYNYLFLESSYVKFIDFLIRKINSKKDSTKIPLLIDFIIMKKTDRAFSDLKVLAIKTLSNFHDKTAMNALVYCLKDKDSNYKIRLACAEALGRIGDKNAFESLSNIVCDESEKSAYIKESAVSALGMLGDNRAIDVFDSIINTKQMFLDKFSYLKERIVEAMTKLDIARDEKAMNILKVSILDSSKQVRINSIEALMNINNKESYELIYERLCLDDDYEVKQNALMALYNMSDRSILDDVITGDFSLQLKNYAKNLIDEYEEIDE